MSEPRIRRRNRLKAKEARALHDQLASAFGGLKLWGEDAAVETGEVEGKQLIIVDRVVHGLMDEPGPFLSVRGLMAYRPATRFVTVDMGAVRFVHNGADVMAPGIVDADPELGVGDWCWVRDEKNHQPLAVGRCLMDGPAMAAATSGKAVASIHYVGDNVWELDAS